MSGWLEYDYLIISRPTQHPLPAMRSEIVRRIELAPRSQWLAIAEADAMLVILADGKGLGSTGHPDCFGFDGSRPAFDTWMSRRLPNVSYCWLDQYVAAFADRAAQESFNAAMGKRLLRFTQMEKLRPLAVEAMGSDVATSKTAQSAMNRRCQKVY